MKIGQLCFFRLSSPVERPYGSAEYGNRYQGQRGPTATRSFQNFHRTDVGVTDAGVGGSLSSSRADAAGDRPRDRGRSRREHRVVSDGGSCPRSASRH